MKSPLPQPLPKECQKAAKIFQSFVDSGNNGLDGVVPRTILENAKGFAIFTIFKAGFLFSARAGSGIVIAKLEDGSWSAPSAIGTAGLGVGGQAGAELTDFLVVLNSKSAVRSFMAAGSLTLGGNLSIAVGPLGRNGEAIGSLNSSGKMAAMYSYSKTRGLFGGVSIEGSVIVERQDANAQAYKSDVTVRQLLSGSVDPPEWAMPLIKTLEQCTGLPGNRKWVQELSTNNDGYMFGSLESPTTEGPSRLKKKNERPSLASKTSYFDFRDHSQGDVRSYSPKPSFGAGSTSTSTSQERNKPTTALFETQFESDFAPETELRKHPKLKFSPTSPKQPLSNSNDLDPFEEGSPFNSLPPFKSAYSSSSPSESSSHRRAISTYTPTKTFTPSHSLTRSLGSRPSTGRTSDIDYLEDMDGKPPSQTDYSFVPKLTTKPALSNPMRPGEGIARAIALFDFKAVQAGDLSFTKGEVITVTEKSDNTDTWWKGKVNGREGSFPANYVEVV
ncbi:hypothetical protein QCA50_011833 [Cerrena zonata]|uniref:SH3 domain-containing protein n=1 Tax=Cerrena zonata TaxID=2478898 RepID=A0AAW0FTP6_9APHY